MLKMIFVTYLGKKHFSRYYQKQTTFDGGSRLYRSYSSRCIIPNKSTYHPVAMSDHFMLEVNYILQEPFNLFYIPKPKLPFKIKPEIVNDPDFVLEIQENIQIWKNLWELYKYDILDWWEFMIKPGIRRIAIKYSRIINKRKNGRLNLLLLKQIHFCKMLRSGKNEFYVKLKSINLEIKNYYEEEAKSIQLLINMRDVSESEKTNIFHHSLHRKKIQKSAIIKIQEEGNIFLGHKACSDFIQNKVAELLENPIEYNKVYQEELLKEISQVFSEEDNLALTKIPVKTELYETLKNSNLMAAPGSD